MMDMETDMIIEDALREITHFLFEHENGDIDSREYAASRLEDLGCYLSGAADAIDCIDESAEVDE